LNHYDTHPPLPGWLRCAFENSAGKRCGNALLIDIPADAKFYGWETRDNKFYCHEHGRIEYAWKS